MRRFYAPHIDLQKGEIELDPEQARHLRDVLRSRAGEEVRVFDGIGREFICTVSEIKKHSCRLKLVAETAPASPESPFDLTVAAAILKGEKYDTVVQKLVELGVKRLIPLLTHRGDVKPKDAERKLERWRRIALEASKQCGRAQLMQIDHPLDFPTLLESSKGGPAVLFSEREGKPLNGLMRSENLVAITGPEGGWDNAELDAAEGQGIGIITLGGRILRAETAAIAIAAILQYRFGDLN